MVMDAQRSALTPTDGDEAGGPVNRALEFSPIKKITLPGAEFDLGGLILIVGPNSSGKSQFIKDILGLISGELRDPVVLSLIEIDKPPNASEFIDALVERRDFRVTRDGTSPARYFPATPLLGSGNLTPDVADNYRNSIETIISRMEVGPMSRNTDSTSHFFKIFGHSLATSLLLEKRLNLLHETQSFDYETAHPRNELQSLYMNAEARNALAQEVKEAFGKGLWVDNSRGGILCIRVSQTPDIPSPEDRLEPQRMREFRLIESEGDGLRSFCGIVVSLLLGLRPICLIDEPELCLHPPQAYRMGLFIGRKSAVGLRTTIVSTHSSHILRGVLESNQNVRILRLSKDQDQFFGNMLTYEDIASSVRRPNVRSEGVLDGVFADGVVLVESDGDRSVYHAAWEEVVRGRPRRDVQFIQVGGTGGFSEIANFFVRLKIPLAVIADLDLLLDEEKLLRLLEVMHADDLSEIRSNAKKLATEIKNIPPLIPAAEASQRINELLSVPLDWSLPQGDQGSDLYLKRGLNRLSGEVDRQKRLKSGGVEGYVEISSIYELLNSLILKCKRYGLFIVPKGELEGWEPAESIGAPSKSKKAQWGMWAVRDLAENSSQWQDLLEFVSEVETFERTTSANLLSITS